MQDDNSPLAPCSVQRSLPVAALLTVAGGSLDAFTYLAHGGVFANAMTGNVVLLGVAIAAPGGSRGLVHLPPIMAFVVGVFIARWLRAASLRPWITDAALTCLLIEIATLALASFLPPSFPDLWLDGGISLVAAMQSSSFTRLREGSYSSVMTTGNLRRFVESAFAACMFERDPAAFRQARVFGTLCVSFFVGAALGALVTTHLDNHALWLPVALLACAYGCCRWAGSGGLAGR